MRAGGPGGRGGRGPSGWYVDALVALVAWTAFAAIVLVHARDVRRDLAQDLLRRRDQVRLSGDLRGLTRLVQALGTAWFLVVVAVVVTLLLLAFGRRRQATAVLVVTTSVLVVVTAVKLAIRHPVAQVVAGLQLGSFPSGHTADLTAVAGVVLLALLPLRWRLLPYAVAVVGGIAVGSSRVVSGAHTPDDVVAGWLLGNALVLTAGAWLTGRAQSSGRAEPDAQQRVHQVADQRRG